MQHPEQTMQHATPQFLRFLFFFYFYCVSASIKFRSKNFGQPFGMQPMWQTDKVSLKCGTASTSCTMKLPTSAPICHPPPLPLAHLHLVEDGREMFCISNCILIAFQPEMPLDIIRLAAFVVGQQIISICEWPRPPKCVSSRPPIAIHLNTIANRT